MSGLSGSNQFVSDSTYDTWQVYGWSLPPSDVVRGLQLQERVSRGESGPFAGWVGGKYWYVYKLSGHGNTQAYYTYLWIPRPRR